MEERGNNNNNTIFSLGQKKTTLKKRKNREKTDPKKCTTPFASYIVSATSFFTLSPSFGPRNIPNIWVRVPSCCIHPFSLLSVAGWLAFLLFLKSYWTIHFPFSLFLKLLNSIQKIKNRKNIPPPHPRCQPYHLLHPLVDSSPSSLHAPSPSIYPSIPSHPSSTRLIHTPLLSPVEPLRFLPPTHHKPPILHIPKIKPPS